jgi:DNA-binding NtrC family response regulator
VVVRESPANAFPRGATGHVGNRVLIVDDSASTARIVAQLLTRAGLVCTHAENGLLAVEAWVRELEARTAFDVTLMDKVRVCMRGAVDRVHFLLTRALDLPRFDV